MKKYVVFCALILVAVILVSAGVSIYQYSRINSLCSCIRNGKTQEAIDIINTLDDVNRSSAPEWLSGAYRLAEMSIDLPLVVACEEGNYEIVKVLLENDADPNKYFEGSWSPIEAAFVHGKEQRLLIAQQLIAYGAEVDSFGSFQSALFNELMTLMYKKSISSEQRKVSYDSIRLLLENGAEKTGRNGNTVAHYLAYIGETELLESVYFKDEEYISCKNEQGETPLFWAISGKSIDAITHLLSLGADPLTEDNTGKSALQYAQETKDDTIISFFKGYEKGKTGGTVLLSPNSN